MIDEIDKAIRYLSEAFDDEYIPVKIETNLISRYAKKLKWARLSSVEKQAKRKSILRSVKKYIEEDGIATFTYENAVVEFYDIGLELVDKLTEAIKDKVPLLRLSILVRIDMDSIDVDSTLHNKRIIPLLVYDNLRSELMAAKCYPEEMDRLIECVKVLNPAMEIPES